MTVPRPEVSGERGRGFRPVRRGRSLLPRNFRILPFPQVRSPTEETRGEETVSTRTGPRLSVPPTSARNDTSVPTIRGRRGEEGRHVRPRWHTSFGLSDLVEELTSRRSVAPPSPLRESTPPVPSPEGPLPFRRVTVVQVELVGSRLYSYMSGPWKPCVWSTVTRRRPVPTISKSVLTEDRTGGPVPDTEWPGTCQFCLWS